MIKSLQQIRNELDQHHLPKLDQTALYEIEQRAHVEISASSQNPEVKELCGLT